MTHQGEYRDEREEARARLKASVDVLAQQASLQMQMQKEPLKLLGGASAVGAVVGLVAGRQLKRSKKVYVDAYSPEKEQKALIKAQKKEKGKGGVGGALVATLTTLAFRALNDKVITPRLEEMANNLLDKAGQPGHRPDGHKHDVGAKTQSPQPRPAQPSPQSGDGGAQPPSSRSTPRPKRALRPSPPGARRRVTRAASSPHPSAWWRPRRRAASLSRRKKPIPTCADRQGGGLEVLS